MGGENSVVIPNGAIVKNLATSGTVNLYAVWAYVTSNGKKESGQGCTTSCFTSGTPVFTSEGYKKIEDIKPGDKVMYKDGTFHKIHDIRHYPNKDNVYNFTVEGNHNYFVGEDGILVHNDKGVDTGGSTGQAAYTCRMYYTRSTKTVSISGVPKSGITSSFITGPNMAGYYTSSTTISSTGTYSGKVWWSGGQTATCSVTVSSL